jgi:hypothetical protein
MVLLGGLLAVGAATAAVFVLGLDRLFLSRGQGHVERIAPAVERPVEPPAGFTALFNGKDLTRWQGAIPVTERFKLQGETLKKRQAEADERARAAWSVRDGILHLDPQGKDRVNLASAQDYRHFELLLDWKVERGGDSGICLRGQPLVRLWDSDAAPAARGEDRGSGSGGLANNPVGMGKRPFLKADRPVGEWNTVRVVVEDNRVTVHLNGTLVVDRQPLLNTLNPSRRAPARGPVELCAGGAGVSFRNVFLRELPAAVGQPRFTPLFNHRDTGGWKVHPQGVGRWKVENGQLTCTGPASYLFSERGDYRNFHLRAEAKINDRGNSGLFFRARFGPGWPAGYEAPINVHYPDPVKTGSLFPDPRQPDLKGIAAILVPRAPHRANEWFTYEVICRGPSITLLVNGKKTIDWKDPKHRHRVGHVALKHLSPGTTVHFRTIEIKDLPERIVGQ